MADLADLARLRGRLPQMVDMLAAFVAAESPSDDLVLVQRALEVIAEHGCALLGVEPEWVRTNKRYALRWTFGTPSVLLLAHADTVWPQRTIDRWPFAVADGVATGPGVFDMKGGLVQGLYAISELQDRNGLQLLVTTDEEIGSPDSQPLIVSTAETVQAVLVLEPSLDGALKTARKGAGSYEVLVSGRSAHAGLDPDAGVNTTVELAHQVLALDALADIARGTRVTPTRMLSGDVGNQIPAHGLLCVDVRAADDAELRRVDRAVRSLQPALRDSVISVEGSVICSPMGADGAKELFGTAAQVWSQLGLGSLSQASVGGTSDGNYAAATGTPTLDGLGPVGGHAHAEGEWLELASMPERAALLLHLIERLQAQDSE